MTRHGICDTWNHYAYNLILGLGTILLALGTTRTATIRSRNCYVNARRGHADKSWDPCASHNFAPSLPHACSPIAAQGHEIQQFRLVKAIPRACPTIPRHTHHHVNIAQFHPPNPHLKREPFATQILWVLPFLLTRKFGAFLLQFWSYSSRVFA